MVHIDNTDSNVSKEYELCQTSAQSLESTIWQSSSFLGIGSLGSLLLVASLENPSQVAIPATIIIVTASFIWWSMAQRWWSIQHTKFTRMLEIERSLSRPGQATYVRYLDDMSDIIRDRKRRPQNRRLRYSRPVTRLRYALPRQQAALLRRVNWPNYYRKGPREVLRIFPWLNLLVWALYLAILKLAA